MVQVQVQVQAQGVLCESFEPVVGTGLCGWWLSAGAVGPPFGFRVPGCPLPRAEMVLPRARRLATAAQSCPSPFAQ